MKVRAFILSRRENSKKLVKKSLSASQEYTAIYCYFILAYFFQYFQAGPLLL